MLSIPLGCMHLRLGHCISICTTPQQQQATTPTPMPTNIGSQEKETLKRDVPANLPWLHPAHPHQSHRPGTSPSPVLILMVLWTHRIALHPRPSRSSDRRERPPTENHLGTSVLNFYPNSTNLPVDGMETKERPKKQTRASQNGHFRTPGLAHGRCLFFSQVPVHHFSTSRLSIFFSAGNLLLGGPKPLARFEIPGLRNSINYHHLASNLFFSVNLEEFFFFSLHCLQCLLGVLEVLGFLLISGPVPCRPVGLGVYYRDRSTPAFLSTLPACPASPVMTLGISSYFQGRIPTRRTDTAASLQVPSARSQVGSQGHVDEVGRWPGQGEARRDGKKTWILRHLRRFFFHPPGVGVQFPGTHGGAFRTSYRVLAELQMYHRLIR
ncbi:hypothetical protein BDP55DRAFT_380653 [Colletotrichum godetiae]|uniref:Uncharacterized protein n=1 Tax=Colletotrichum godetiae TaxID=1209918 RepID=A0AAJ0AVN3_9PEZI|nr:uncharacterized protein BDP55DRAFT_380653 [Colletotrichum godetiae]KAK1689836.1 hypothetical protein BDP55DRAFT_380653 [Colletotrichum godetiae]